MDLTDDHAKFFAHELTRRNLFDAQDQIDARREAIIQDIEGRLAPAVILEPVLTIGWRLV